MVGTYRELPISFVQSIIEVIFSLVRHTVRYGTVGCVMSPRNSSVASYGHEVLLTSRVSCLIESILGAFHVSWEARTEE